MQIVNGGGTWEETSKCSATEQRDAGMEHRSHVLRRKVFGGFVLSYYSTKLFIMEMKVFVQMQSFLQDDGEVCPLKAALGLRAVNSCSFHRLSLNEIFV